MCSSKNCVALALIAIYEGGNRMKTRLLYLLWAASAPLTFAADNLIPNGSFESGLNSWTLSHDYLYPFWKRQWDYGGENLFPANYNYGQGIWMNYNAQAGLRAVNVHSASLYQIVNTVPGQEYRLSFCVGSFDDGSPPTSDLPRLGSLDLAVLQGASLSTALSQFFAGYQIIPGDVSVDWQRYDNSEPGMHTVNWIPFDYSFVAAATQAVFIFQGGGYSFSIYTGLDSVSLTAVPEPASSAFVMMGAAFFAATLCRRRRPNPWWRLP